MINSLLISTCHDNPQGYWDWCIAEHSSRSIHYHAFWYCRWTTYISSLVSRINQDFFIRQMLTGSFQQLLNRLVGYVALVTLVKSRDRAPVQSFFVPSCFFQFRHFLVMQYLVAFSIDFDNISGHCHFSYLFPSRGPPTSFSRGPLPYAPSTPYAPLRNE